MVAVLLMLHQSTANALITEELHTYQYTQLSLPPSLHVVYYATCSLSILWQKSQWVRLE
eukprot:COSAG01_NODE_930_length_12664_cov_2.440032_15_plen_59_part_00